MDPQVGQAIGGLVPSTAFVERRHASTDHAVFVVVPWRRFFAIDGVGGPMSADYDVGRFRTARHPRRVRAPDAP